MVTPRNEKVLDATVQVMVAAMAQFNSSACPTGIPDYFADYFETMYKKIDSLIPKDK